MATLSEKYVAAILKAGEDAGFDVTDDHGKFWSNHGTIRLLRKGTFDVVAELTWEAHDSYWIFAVEAGANGVKELSHHSLKTERLSEYLEQLRAWFAELAGGGF